MGRREDGRVREEVDVIKALVKYTQSASLFKMWVMGGKSLESHIMQGSISAA